MRDDDNYLLHSANRERGDHPKEAAQVGHPAKRSRSMRKKTKRREEEK